MAWQALVMLGVLLEIQSMKPIDALWKTIIGGLAACSRRGKPGEVIPRMGKEIREALEELKSDDIKDARIK